MVQDSDSVLQRKIAGGWQRYPECQSEDRTPGNPGGHAALGLESLEWSTDQDQDPGDPDDAYCGDPTDMNPDQAERVFKSVMSQPRVGSQEGRSEQKSGGPDALNTSGAAAKAQR